MFKDRPVRRAASQWRKIWNPQTIVIGALLSVGVAFIMVDVLGKHLMADSRASLPATAIVSHYVAPAFLLWTLTIVVGSVGGAFRRRDQKALLTTVIAAYFSLMLVFASVYYEMAFSGDLRDAVFKYDHYRADALRHVASPLYSDRRAFHGIERRFWSGLDWPLSAGDYPSGEPPAMPTASPEQMRDTAGRMSAGQRHTIHPRGTSGDLRRLSPSQRHHDDDRRLRRYHPEAVRAALRHRR